MITGDTGTGKTALTARLLDQAVSLGLASTTTALDLAPTITTGPPELGRSLKDFTRNTGRVRYLRPAVIRAPRLEGRTRNEVLGLAEANAKTIEPLLSKLIQQPNPILFINDLTLYLQAGDPDRIIDLFGKPETVIANAYRGVRLREDHGSGLSEREELSLGVVERAANRVIRSPLKNG